MCVRYLDSEFMGHATTNDLLTNLFDVINNKDGGNHMIHVSRDGPSINGKFFEFLQKGRIDKEQHELIDMGSFSLHIMHVAFKIRQKVPVGIIKLFKGEFRILHDPQKGRLTCNNKAKKYFLYSFGFLHMGGWRTQMLQTG